MNHPFVYADTPMVVSVKAFMVMMLTPQENRNAAKTTVTFIIAWALHKNTYWYFVVFFSEWHARSESIASGYANEICMWKLVKKLHNN